MDTRPTLAFLDALQAKDFPAVAAALTEDTALTVALSFSGAPEPAGRFTGKEQVLGYLTQVFTTMGTIRFTDVRVSVADAGRTTFVQANGDFTTADGRPYRNVYVFRYDWRDGLIARTEEYGNPVTFSRTFGSPEG